jgi:hypothetical protein
MRPASRAPAQSSDPNRVIGDCGSLVFSVPAGRNSPVDIRLNRRDNDFSAFAVFVANNFVGLQQLIKTRVADAQQMLRLTRAYDEGAVFSEPDRMNRHLRILPNSLRTTGI